MFKYKYRDAVIISNDLDTLNPHGWINDAIIFFALRYIEHETQIATSSLRHIYNFIPPSVIIWMKDVHNVQIMREHFVTNDVHQKEFHIMIVNDTKQQQLNIADATGSH